jgi:hypothetical protein
MATMVTFRSRAITSGKVIPELNAIVHVIANGLHKLPATLDMSERRPRRICQMLLK